MVTIDKNYPKCRLMQLTDLANENFMFCYSEKKCFYKQFWLWGLCFKRHHLNYFKIDTENKPQLALHHLSLGFRPFLHSHSCCSSQPITQIFLQWGEAGLDLPLFACSYLHLDWTPAIAPGNRISTINLLKDFLYFYFIYV